MRTPGWRALALVAVVAGIATDAVADQVQHGRVVAVGDGHSVVVLVDDRRLRVRLAHVDAPTGRERHAIVSRQSLIAMCGGEPARVESRAREADGTAIGRVVCNGTDAAAEQVRRGMAVAVPRHGGPDAKLATLQAEAQAAKRGVWADARTSAGLLPGGGTAR